MDVIDAILQFHERTDECQKRPLTDVQLNSKQVFRWFNGDIDTTLVSDALLHTGIVSFAPRGSWETMKLCVTWEYVPSAELKLQNCKSNPYAESRDLKR